MKRPSALTSLAAFLALVAVVGFVSSQLGVSVQTQALTLLVSCWLFLGALGAQANGSAAEASASDSWSCSCSARSVCWRPTTRAVESARRAGAAACIGTPRDAPSVALRSEGVKLADLARAAARTHRRRPNYPTRRRPAAVVWAAVHPSHRGLRHSPRSAVTLLLQSSLAERSAKVNGRGCSANRARRSRSRSARPRRFARTAVPRTSSAALRSLRKPVMPTTSNTPETTRVKVLIGPSVWTRRRTRPVISGAS
jgi:hypothetical protein